jgi:glycosyltransferase involved in cell wall biosynthesis
VDAVIVVDDASDDGTVEVALSTGDPRVVVERHARNRGVGAAIVTGYRRAAVTGGEGRDAFVVMAGDGQMDPRDLPAVVAPIARGRADYVKGDRFRSPATARAIGRPVSDSQCGYTAISRTACAALDLDGLWPRYGYPNDLLSQIALRGLRLAEVPVRAVYADEVSRLKPRHVPLVAGLVARAWARRVFGLSLRSG